MAPKKKPEIQERSLQGLKYLELVQPLLSRLHSEGTERDRAGNRRLYYDQYAGLLLLKFFSPAVTSLRALQQASQLKKVQKLLGCSRASLGSLSEASRVFDAEVLQGVIQELALQVPSPGSPQEREALQGLTAVDGSLLPALPKMAWALWLDDRHRAAKIHLAFEVLRAIPVKLRVTEGNGSEKNQLRRMLEPGRLYAIDRGYAEYELLQAIVNAGSSFICRIRDNAVFKVIEERSVSKEAKAAGVQRDLVVKLGGPKTGAVFQQELRVVVVHTGKKDARGEPDVLFIATDRLDLPAELVALGYKFRWSIELFFRWFKCILGCRHLLSLSENGVRIQVYVAIIASLLLSLWTGRKPTKRTLEMFCHYFSGLADEEELNAHIEKLQSHSK